MNWLDTAGERKFIVAVLIVVLSFAALLLGRIDGDDWSSIVVWVMGLFGGAVAAERLAAGGKDDKLAREPKP